MASIKVEEKTTPAAKEKIYKAGDIIYEPGLYRRVYSNGEKDDSFFYVNHHEEVIVIEPGYIASKDMSSAEYVCARFIRVPKRTIVTVTLNN